MNMWMSEWENELKRDLIPKIWGTNAPFKTENLEKKESKDMDNEVKNEM